MMKSPTTFAVVGKTSVRLQQMASSGSAHFWANKLQGLGHMVKLMAPQFVNPYVKSHKNDAADAEVICEVVSRPNSHFVPIKTSEQQAVLALHRARQRFVKARTARGNQIRGLLAEHGIVMPQGMHTGYFKRDGWIALRLSRIQLGSQPQALVLSYMSYN